MLKVIILYITILQIRLDFFKYKYSQDAVSCYVVRILPIGMKRNILIKYYKKNIKQIIHTRGLGRWRIRSVKKFLAPCKKESKWKSVLVFNWKSQEIVSYNLWTWALMKAAKKKHIFQWQKQKRPDRQKSRFEHIIRQSVTTYGGKNTI